MAQKSFVNLSTRYSSQSCVGIVAASQSRKMRIPFDVRWICLKLGSVSSSTFTTGSFGTLTTVYLSIKLTSKTSVIGEYEKTKSP